MDQRMPRVENHSVLRFVRIHVKSNDQGKPAGSHGCTERLLILYLSSRSGAAYRSDHGNKRSNSAISDVSNACHGNNNTNNIRLRPRLFIEAYSPLKWL